ncbi:MAG: lactate utilization protein [Deltaproteobacteria bacterium]|jgi:L-lactate dehydrogenase complex protein LldG|nr:lactate utilization protein [Deltaproteobacteria bacterium]
MPNSEGPPSFSAVNEFKKKAQAVSTETVEVKGLGGALDYLLKVAKEASPASLLPVSGAEFPKASNRAEPRKKLIAAPGLTDADFDRLDKKASELGFGLIRKGLRDFVSGFEVAFSVAAFGVAETATCVLENESEDARLAGMLAETHVVALDKKRLFETSRDALGLLEAALNRPANFVSFISGPSRTSDIERVLTLGVHGPFHFHVALMD